MLHVIPISSVARGYLIVGERKYGALDTAASRGSGAALLLTGKASDKIYCLIFLKSLDHSSLNCGHSLQTLVSNVLVIFAY